MEKDLVIYTLPGCPYCRKVLNFMQQRGIDIKTVSTSEPGAREYLETKGGKFQAPCLFIDGKAMYESDDIIAWLDNEFPAK